MGHGALTPAPAAWDYALSLSNLNTTTFTATAAPQGAQATDPCGGFTLTHQGTRGVTGGTLTAAQCW